jgi:hypothetical protein
MEVYTLDRNFHQQDEIDVFHSIIWTERYYGDSEVELVVPAEMPMIKKLKPGLLLGVAGSDRIMILETMTIENEKMKFTGQSLLPWLNNRFVRATSDPKAESWSVGPGTPGWILWAIVYWMCCQGSPYLNGTINTGIPNPERLVIPGLGLDDYDKSGDSITVKVPYVGVYDALREIATTHRIGMQITLRSVTDTSYSLGFRSYRGVDRTSSQSVNPPVRFSPQMDSLRDIKEVQSIAALKTLVYAFAKNNPGGLATGPGVASLTGMQYTGFDLRALQVLTSDITNDPNNPLDAAKLNNLLTEEANSLLYANSTVKAVDGEIVPENQFQYGVDYNLGDIIEIQGNSDVISNSRVTEYIRAQDEAGERSYPTVAMLD